MFSVRKNSFLNLTGAASNRRSIKTINSLKAFVVYKNFVYQPIFRKGVMYVVFTYKHGRSFA